MDELEKYAAQAEYNGLDKNGRKLKALVVDDSLAVRRLLRRMLESVGYEVSDAQDGTIGVAKYQRDKPDVVAMDVTMPEMEGPDAVAAICKKDPSAAIVMITSMGHKELVEECITKGAKGYILKPLTQGQLPKVLATIKKAALKENA